MTRRFAVTLRFSRGCASLALAFALTACATVAVAPADELPALAIERALAPLLPTDVLLLGEQHDAPAHQRRQRAVASALQARGQWAGLVIEMAERGGSTKGLPASATEAQARSALRWERSELAGWSWSIYSPLVMQAVRAGVPVWGGNLPRADFRRAMQDTALDGRLSSDALMAQQARIREGHCQLLPETQVAPMTRIQIARDLAMAATAEAAWQPGRTVLLVAGHQHVRRDLGVPLHLGAQVNARVIAMTTTTQSDLEAPASADLIWRTAPVDSPDHCAELKSRLTR